MNQPFTASEVRNHLARSQQNERTIYDKSVTYEMLHAYADRLEADEKAVPVADFWAAVMKNNAGQWDVIHAYSAHDGNDGNDARTEMNDWINENNPKCSLKPLYLNVPPADAERLAEALRDARDTVLAFLGDVAADGSRCGMKQAVIKSMFASLLDRFAAHSAQAQPPAASVPDARDARRYRWLKHCTAGKWDQLNDDRLRGKLDTAIDAAMAKESGNG